MQKWENNATLCPQGAEVQVANRMGQEGWELVSHVPCELPPQPVHTMDQGVLKVVGQTPGGPGFHLLFKRPLPGGDAVGQAAPAPGRRKGLVLGVG